MKSKPVKYLRGELSTTQEQTAMVKRVGGKIQNAVERYFAERGLAGQLKDYRWEVNLVESKDVNAWCMPGGKIVVYTGILPVTQTEAGLAVVMGHEVAHAVAEHGNERMSQGLLAQLGAAGLSVALQNKPAETKNLWMQAYSVGAQYGALLPFSRTQESEADEIGLTFMAMAGYDPNEAVGFWQRMSQQSGGSAPPEFMSTHPSDATRIADIKKHIPEAASWHISHEVRNWIRDHNRAIRQQGQGVRIVACYLPSKSPWLNRIETHWVHGKRNIVEPARLLTAQEVADRVCTHFGCDHESHLTIAEKVA